MGIGPATPNVVRRDEVVIQPHNPVVAICQALLALQKQLEEHTAKSMFEYGLHEYLTDFLDQIGALNNALQGDYFEAYLAADVECAT